MVFSRYLSAVIKAKKHLGQHFLKDQNIARKIVASRCCDTGNTLEVGPGTGVLTDLLLVRVGRLKAIELDVESVAFLKAKYHDQKRLEVIHGDFLSWDLTKVFGGEPFALIGNFPYHISTQIVFKALENKALIPELVGMFQKEVALRLAAKHGSKTYGITSVLTQAFYQVDYCFSVGEKAFSPPPKVQSGLIRMRRKETSPIRDEKLFFQLVKTAFNQRRKTLRNALKCLALPDAVNANIPRNARAEQLSVADFVQLATQIAAAKGREAP